MTTYLTNQQALIALLEGKKIRGKGFTYREFLYSPDSHHIYDEVKKDIIFDYVSKGFVSKYLIFTEDGYPFGDIFSETTHCSYDKWNIVE